MNIICGLPRSGSTLLCNVLNQNPAVWASSTSILPSICASLVNSWSRSPELKGALNIDREQTEERLKDTLRTVCEKWHGDHDNQIVFDKSRAWSHNLLMLFSIYPEAKIVITIRDLREVYASIEKQHRRTGFFDEAPDLKAKTLYGRADALFSPEGIIGMPLAGIKDIIDRKLPVHWIKYEDLARSPKNTMANLYKYLDLDPFDGHDFNNVIPTSTDPDWLYNFKFPHDGSGKVETPKTQWPDYMSDSMADLLMQKFGWFQVTFEYSANII